MLLVILLTACAQSVTVTPSSTVHGPSSTTPSSTDFRPSSTTTPSLSATPIPCDPSTADYCIVEGTFFLLRPIAPPGTNTVDRAYAYGSTAGGTRDPHHGVEFYNGSGTPVLAAADGTVFYAGDDTTNKFSPWSNFYGTLVILEHTLRSQKVYTLYAHLSKIDVVVGQSVAAGEKIAEVGASGSAIGSHLHFEVRLDPQDYASTLNPELWLIPLPDMGILSLRFVNESDQFVQAQPNVQFYPDPITVFTQAWYPEVYAAEMNQGNNWENATLGDLSAGWYRITYLWEGVLYERWVQVQPGKLTLAILKVP
ncbi:MAG: M23 family metallopeptidase [Chloroflexota bacterium]